MIDVKKLKALIELMATHDLTQMDLEDGTEKIKLRRGPDGSVQPVVMPAAPAPVAAAAPALPPAAAAPEPAAAEAPAPTGPTIDSPMVGTFYSASSPDADAFVKVGDAVSADTVVCIVEAMKVFNEIKAETSGTVAEVLIENGQAVEFGQPLFRLK
ncbi:MAG: acetyl-CoA carboxylase biotin carboxyl carrier protein [Planctomycetota bacterium]